MTSCDNCHVVAVIGPWSTDISDALEMMGAVPLELTVANTMFWWWSESKVRGPYSQQRMVPTTAMHGRGQIVSDPRESPLSAESSDESTDRPLPGQTPEWAHHRPGGLLDA